MSSKHPHTNNSKNTSQHSQYDVDGNLVIGDQDSSTTADARSNNVNHNTTSVNIHFGLNKYLIGGFIVIISMLLGARVYYPGVFGFPVEVSPSLSNNMGVGDVGGDDKPIDGEITKPESVSKKVEPALPPITKNTKKTAPPYAIEKDKKIETIYASGFKGEFGIIPINETPELENNLVNILNQIILSQNLSISKNLLEKQFLFENLNEIKFNSLSFLSSENISNRVNCACIFNSSIKLTDSTISNKTIVSARGIFELHFINLQTNQESKINIEIGGAGANQERAIKSMEDKFTNEFLKLNQFNFKKCK